MQTRNRISNKLRELDVVVLCGGRASRLRPVLKDRPKPMAQMNHLPFLDILINYFSRFGFRRFVLCTGYMSQIIQDYYSTTRSSLRFIISDERTPLGTAGTVKNAEHLIQSDPFLVTNGDSFCSVDLAEFYNFHLSKQALMSMVVVESDDTKDCGLVVSDDSQRITGFDEKAQKPRSGHINAGIYLFQKEILSFIPQDTKFSLEYDLFPKLAGLESYAFLGRGKLLDIGTPQRYERAKQYFSSHPEVLLVRDFGPKQSQRLEIKSS